MSAVAAVQLVWSNSALFGPKQSTEMIARNQKAAVETPQETTSLLIVLRHEGDLA